MAQQGYPQSPGYSGGMMAAPGSPVVFMVQDDAFMVARQDPSQKDYSIRTKNPDAVGILHDAQISESWKCWPCFFLTPNCWCWPWLKSRTYVRVAEDGVEAEYPFVWFPFCCSESCICQYHPCTHKKVFFHSCATKSIKPARCCTPYHCCCCVPCTGEVVSLAPCDAVNCCLCCCLLHYLPGLENSERVARIASKARYQWEEAKKANDANLRPSAFVQNAVVQMTAPQAQVMMGGSQVVPSAPQMPGLARPAW